MFCVFSLCKPLEFICGFWSPWLREKYFTWCHAAVSWLPPQTYCQNSQTGQWLHIAHIWPPLRKLVFLLNLEVDLPRIALIFFDGDYIKRVYLHATLPNKNQVPTVFGLKHLSKHPEEFSIHWGCSLEVQRIRIVTICTFVGICPVTV